MATLLIQTCVFEEFVTNFVVNNGHHKDKCCNNIGLCPRNGTSNLDSIVYTIRRGPMWLFKEKGNLHQFDVL